MQDALHAFNARGLDALQKGSSRPHRPPAQAFPGARAEQSRALLHRSPREFGHPTSLWTLNLAAQVSCAEGLTPTVVSGEAIRQTLPRLGISWASAGHQLETRQTLDHQPRSSRRPKKGRRDRLIALAEAHPDWALGFADEVWWSRLAPPQLHAWADAAHPLRLVEQTIAPDDPDPKALACYGVLLRRVAQTEQNDTVWVRFVDGRPVSAITMQFLDWCCAQLAARRIPVWILIWDNASWHVSKAVRAWIRTHNQAVKQQGHGVRILVCYLPVKSPWLNPIEPKWIHTKRAIVEPTRLLSAQEVAERVCRYLDCSHEPHLALPDPILDQAS